jgi:8-oxo-dGTP pyrophosphatase MutT (NUDIX family)
MLAAQGSEPMPMSEYIRSIRERIGTAMLEVPTVSVLVFDRQDRVLLVRHVEGDVWTTPGGMIEPLETPADAAVRETWEETGVHVDLVRIVGVFGGSLCSGTYSNGDRVAWVSTVFEGTVLDGVPRPDHQETLEARYVAVEELRTLRRRQHVDVFVDAALRRQVSATFQPASWIPERT